MGSMSLMVAVVVAVVLGVGLWALLRQVIQGYRSPDAPGQEEPVSDPLTAPVYRGEAGAALTAVLLGIAVTALIWQAGTWWPRGYGLPYALSAGVGSIAGLVAYALWPRTAWDTRAGERVHAELTPRKPTSFAGQWVFALPLTTAIALILGLVLTGVYSSTDQNGLHRVYQRRALSGWGVESGQVVDLQYNLSSSGPFPGWYYGIPVMIGTALLVVVVYWSLRRIAAAPRPGSPALFGADTALRASRTGFVMAFSSSALAFQIAGLLAVTGNVLRFSHLDPVPTADTFASAATVPVEPGHTLALIMIVCSLVVAVTAVVLFVKALGIMAGLWSAGRVVRTSRPAAAQ